MTSDVELLATGDDIGARVTVSPSAGGRIRQIAVSNRRRAGDDPITLLAETTDTDPGSTGWGSFPMAPWAGRIRNGRFTFLGADVALDLNHQDGSGDGGGTVAPPAPATTGDLADEDQHRHAIHGTTFARPWTVDAFGASELEMSCDLVGALGWPFRGVARQVITVRPHGVDLAMRVESVDGSVFPASLGWHPWFAKPDRLDFDPVAMYEQDAGGLPTGRLVPPPPGPWDDCFVNHRPVRLHYDRPCASTVTVTSPCSHWVVFDRPDHATCVEPQTGPPDAPTLRPELVSAESPLSTTMNIAWT